jgi:hypothetical protein
MLRLSIEGSQVWLSALETRICRIFCGYPLALWWTLSSTVEETKNASLHIFGSHYSQSFFRLMPYTLCTWWSTVKQSKTYIYACACTHICMPAKEKTWQSGTRYFHVVQTWQPNSTQHESLRICLSAKVDVQMIRSSKLQKPDHT